MTSSVHIVLGGDHGQGSFRCAVKLIIQTEVGHEAKKQIVQNLSKG